MQILGCLRQHYLSRPNKILYVLIFSLWLFNAGEVFAKEPVKIRVAVLKGARQAGISITGPYEIIDAWTKISISHGKNLTSAKIVLSDSGLKIRNTDFNTDGIIIIPKKKITVINNRSYRGDVAVFKDADGSLLVVNILDLESYIKGVLQQEISHKWPIEAIKAQAVAARTYAVYQKEVMKSKNYDLTADTSSQVYGGYSSEKRKTNRAVNFTFGEVLSYKGRIFPAYFHATCGGVTENASELWKIDIEPLRGDRLCSFCLNSPHYYWKATLDLKNIQKKLKDLYKVKGDLKNIVVAERTSTARARTLGLTDAKGETFNIPAKDFRLLLGADLIRSTNFSIILDQERVIFSGKGWGHGVGLCQWGAYGMSRQGHDYKEILGFYYPGSEIVKIQ